MVTAADHTAAALWALWAAKEAAYKVIKKSCRDASFTPRRWTVHVPFQKAGKPGASIAANPDSPEAEKYGSLRDQDAFQSAAGHVIIPGNETVYVRLFFFASCVHCVASDCRDTLSAAVWHLEEINIHATGLKADPSLFVRQALLNHLSARLNLNSADMKIHREKRDGELLPPCVYLHHNKLPVDISLSHDGPFVAYVFQISHWA
jgi:hypothetical protein